MSSPPVPSTAKPRSRYRLAILLALVVAAGAVGGTVWWSSRRGDADRQAALQAARSGDFATAEPLLKAALEHQPNDAEVVTALAKGYLESDPVRAEEYLSRWVALRPKDPEPLQARRKFHEKYRHGELAFADARRLAELDPGNLDYKQQAMAQAIAAGLFAEAEEYCRAVLEVQPKNADARVNLANVREARGDPAGAAAILDAVLEDNPRNTRAMFKRATLYDQAGQPEKAVPLFRKVLELDPRRQRTTAYQLSLALKKMGDDAEADKVMKDVRRMQDLAVFQDAIRTQPDNLDLHVRLAESLLNDGHTQDGLGLLNTVLNRDPAYRPAHQVLASYYERSGQPAKAAEHRRRAGAP